MIAAVLRVTCRPPGSGASSNAVLNIDFPSRIRHETTAHVLAESDHFSVVRFSGELLTTVVMTDWQVLLELHAEAQRLADAFSLAMSGQAPAPTGAVRDAWNLKMSIETLSSEMSEQIRKA